MAGDSASRTHTFEVQGQWSGPERRGKVGLGGEQAVVISVPVPFGGNVPGTNPEELLLASALSCYMMTLARVLAGRGLDGRVVDATIIGEVRRTSTGLHFDCIRLRPLVRMDGLDETGRRWVEEALRNAEDACFIAQTLRPVIPYHLEPIYGD